MLLKESSLAFLFFFVYCESIEWWSKGFVCDICREYGTFWNETWPDDVDDCTWDPLQPSIMHFKDVSYLSKNCPLYFMHHSFHSSAVPSFPVKSRTAEDHHRNKRTTKTKSTYIWSRRIIWDMKARYRRFSGREGDLGQFSCRLQDRNATAILFPLHPFNHTTNNWKKTDGGTQNYVVVQPTYCHYWKWDYGGFQLHAWPTESATRGDIISSTSSFDRYTLCI